LTHWNDQWRGRENELRYQLGETNPNQWQRNLGTNLILALATAKSWLTDESGLRTLRQLAIDSDVQQQLERMIADWEKKPWGISFTASGKQQRFEVLQYELHSITSVEGKLAQFPPGSSFTWAGGTPGSEDERRVLRRISDFVTKHGMKLVNPAN
jgi:hypothetical protein